MNTGWSGGGAGVGKRMPINVTRTLLRAALSGELSKGAFEPDGVFGLMIPEGCEGVPSEILQPRMSVAGQGGLCGSCRKA